MTNVLLREMLRDYISGKLPLESQYDFDIAIRKLLTKEERRIILLYAMGYSPSEISTRPTIENELKLIFMLLGEELRIGDLLLYRKVKKTKHGQLRSFLTFANERYEDLSSIVELWKKK